MGSVQTVSIESIDFSRSVQTVSIEDIDFSRSVQMVLIENNIVSKERKIQFCWIFFIFLLKV